MSYKHEVFMIHATYESRRYQEGVEMERYDTICVKKYICIK